MHWWVEPTPPCLSILFSKRSHAIFPVNVFEKFAHVIKASFILVLLSKRFFSVITRWLPSPESLQVVFKSVTLNILQKRPETFSDDSWNPLIWIVLCAFWNSFIVLLNKWLPATLCRFSSFKLFCHFFVFQGSFFWYRTHAFAKLSPVYLHYTSRCWSFYFLMTG